ncbi:MAG: hypothetical protein ACE5JE_02655 [Thermoplasmata archaeon]
MRARALLGTSLLVLLLVFAAFGARAQAADVDVTLSFSNLAPLAEDHYEGWLIVGGSPVSTGKFIVADRGDLEDLQGNPISTFRVANVELDQTTTFVLSIEPAGDTDTIPGAVKALAGDLNAAKTSAALTPNLGVSLEGIGGQYILATPSDGMATNENSGVWFLDRSGASPVAGLTLPDLSATDWIYEGWAVIDGVPVTTGKFDMPDGADLSAPSSGTQGTPPFPGEDFLVNAPSGLTFPTDLASRTIVISIEPRGAADTDPGPFQFKPLAGDVPSGATDHTEYDLTDQSSTLASGSATIASVSAAAPIDMVLVGVIIAVVVAVIIIVAVVLVRRQGSMEQE